MKRISKFACSYLIVSYLGCVVGLDLARAQSDPSFTGLESGQATAAAQPSTRYLEQLDQEGRLAGVQPSAESQSALQSVVETLEAASDGALVDAKLKVVSSLHVALEADLARIDAIAAALPRGTSTTPEALAALGKQEALEFFAADLVVLLGVKTAAELRAAGAALRARLEKRNAMYLLALLPLAIALLANWGSDAHEEHQAKFRAQQRERDAHADLAEANAEAARWQAEYARLQAENARLRAGAK